MFFDRRILRFGATAFGMSVVGGGAVALSVFPAAAGVVAAVTTVTCSVTGANWCISGNNSGSGIGVIGTSKTGTGLRGASTSQYGLKATSLSGDAILAQTVSGTHAIYGLGGASGVFGTTGNGQGYGVEGFASGSGVGVYGFSAKGIGVLAGSTSSTAVYANSNSTSPTVQVYNAKDAAGDFTGGLGVRASGSAYSFVATKSTNPLSTTFAVDDYGNIYYKGGLINSAKVSGGATITSYGPNSTRPTVEDTGTAQLVGGAAAVRLDPVFVAAIDAPSSYRVFVTPNGDTHGLFVAAKMQSGFIVRESQGGKSTVTFDYRIVATAVGKANQRMAFAAPGTTLPVLPAAKQPSLPAVLPASAPSQQ